MQELSYNNSDNINFIASKYIHSFVNQTAPFPSAFITSDNTGKPSL